MSRLEDGRPGGPELEVTEAGAVGMDGVGKTLSRLESFRAMMRCKAPIIAGVNLLPLPGTPNYDRAGGIRKIVSKAKDETSALIEEGADALLFSNEADVPWRRQMRTQSVAAFAAIVGELTHDVGVPFGLCALIDSVAALALAHATGAGFVRGTYAGAYCTDIGVVDSNPAPALEMRASFGGNGIMILHNLAPSMGRPLVERSFTEEAKGALAHCGVDGFMVPGDGIAGVPSIEAFARLRGIVPGVPLVAGRGVGPENLEEFARVSDGMVVVSCLRQGGHYLAPLDQARLREFMAIARKVRSKQ